MGIAVYSTPLTKRQQQEYLRLLDSCDLRDEGDADIIALATDDDGSLVGCGALAGNTVKQLAVSQDAEGQGIMASILSSLISEAYAMGRHRLFLCTKPDNSRMFSSMGFYPVIETGDALLMENRRDGFESFIDSIPRYTGVCGAVVCNCDPFTLGHRHLAETAAKAYDRVLVFVVEEENGAIPFSVRYRLVREGLRDLPSRDIVTFHEAFPYFAASYGLHVVAVVNKEPGEVLTPTQMGTLAAEISRLGNPPLFIEPQYTDLSARTLAQETGASVFMLDPVVTGPEENVPLDYYETAMLKNMDTLIEALSGPGRPQ